MAWPGGYSNLSILMAWLLTSDTQCQPSLGPYVFAYVMGISRIRNGATVARKSFYAG